MSWDAGGHVEARSKAEVAHRTAGGTMARNHDQRWNVELNQKGPGGASAAGVGSAVTLR